MKFVEMSELSLMCHGEWHTRPVEGTLLVGEAVAKFAGETDRTGEMTVRLYPAYHAGVKCWLVQHEFTVFSGQGTDPWPGENIIPFEEGVKRLLERGAYDHLWP